MCEGFLVILALADIKLEGPTLSKITCAFITFKYCSTTKQCYSTICKVLDNCL